MCRALVSVTIFVLTGFRKADTNPGYVSSSEDTERHPFLARRGPMRGSCRQAAGGLPGAMGPGQPWSEEGHLLGPSVMPTPAPGLLLLSPACTSEVIRRAGPQGLTHLSKSLL